MRGVGSKGKEEMSMSVKWVLIMTLVALTIAQPLLAEEPSPQDRLEQFVQTYARVDWHQIVTPFQRILLIRQGDRFGVVRFTEFHQETDIKPTSDSSRGKVTKYAEYDWFYQDDGSGSFMKQNAKRGHGKLVEKPLRGIGRLAFQTGTVYVEFGHFKLFWLYPTSVSFASEPGCTDLSVELAPTKWTSIEDVSVHDTKIKWYRCDEKRKSFLVHVDDL
jgi:hypothetical protein